MTNYSMHYTAIGNSDLMVSRIALGCMGFANPRLGVNRWALDQQTAAPIFRRAVELGITLWDTANGTSPADDTRFGSSKSAPITRRL